MLAVSDMISVQVDASEEGTVLRQAAARRYKCNMIQPVRLMMSMMAGLKVFEGARVEVKTMNECIGRTSAPHTSYCTFRWRILGRAKG